jgi:hypothetical protein
MDVIEAQNGDLVIVGNINSSAPLFENPYSRDYFVRTNSSGDTLITRTKLADIFYANLLELSSGEFRMVGTEDAGNLCGFTGSLWPFSDYTLQTYDANGTQIATANIDEDCIDAFRDRRTLTDGSILGLGRSEDINGVRSFSIDHLDINGNWTTIQIPTAYMLQIEEAPNGYWVSRENNLFKFSNAGQLLWDQPMPFISYITDFCAVENDSLVFTYASQLGDSGHVVKTDSIGNYSWDKTFDFRPENVITHSSGNYIVSGSKDSTLVTLWLNAQGDSIWGADFPVIYADVIAVKTIELENGGIAATATVGGFGQQILIVLALDPGPFAGVTNLAKDFGELKVYPNPSNGLFEIECKQQVSWEIMTLTGNVILKGDDSSIDLSNEPDGLYMLHCTNGESSHIEKMVLKR